MIHVLTVMHQLREANRRLASRATDAPQEVTAIPEKALQLLTRPEKRFQRTFCAGGDHDSPTLVDGFVTCHSTARGPALCPMYLHPGVTQDDVDKIAEKMVWKTALMGLPFGGGCIGLRPHSYEKLDQVRTLVVREFATVYRSLLASGVVAVMPGYGVRNKEMGVLSDEIERRDIVAGKPRHQGGLPGFNASRGRGISAATELAVRARFRKGLAGKVCAIYGFGSEGRWTAYFLHSAGAKVVAVGDNIGGLFNVGGLPVPHLLTGLPRGMPVTGLGGRKLTSDDVLDLDVDVLVITDFQNLFPADRASRCRATAVVEGSDDAVSDAADQQLSARGITVVPDLLATSGDLVAAHLELFSARTRTPMTRRHTLSAVDSSFAAAFDRLQRSARRQQQGYSAAAQSAALENLVTAMYQCGWL